MYNLSFNFVWENGWETISIDFEIMPSATRFMAQSRAPHSDFASFSHSRTFVSSLSRSLCRRNDALDLCFLLFLAVWLLHIAQRDWNQFVHDLCMPVAHWPHTYPNVSARIANLVRASPFCSIIVNHIHGPMYRLQFVRSSMTWKYRWKLWIRFSEVANLQLTVYKRQMETTELTCVIYNETGWRWRRQRDFSHHLIESITSGSEWSVCTARSTTTDECGSFESQIHVYYLIALKHATDLSFALCIVPKTLSSASSLSCQSQKANETNMRNETRDVPRQDSKLPFKFFGECKYTSIRFFISFSVSVSVSNYVKRNVLSNKLM